VLCSEATDYLVGILNPVPTRERIVWIERIIERVRKAKLRTALLGKDVIETAAKVNYSIADKANEKKGC